MADDLNNNIIDENTKPADEVVDDIPENAKNINDNKASYSSVHVEATVSPENSLMGILSLALGIFSVICCCTFIPSGISAIIGLILGIVSLKTDKGSKNFAIIGIILCAIGLAIFIISGAIFVIAGSINASFEIPATMHSMTM